MTLPTIAPLLNRPVEELRSLSLPIGPVEVCAERLAAFPDAGAQRLFIWPVRDEVKQLEVFCERAVPMLR
jgi:2-methylisocitrate lyase-like PEP mutase family enzyme